MCINFGDSNFSFKKDFFFFTEKPWRLQTCWKLVENDQRDTVKVISICLSCLVLEVQMCTHGQGAGALQRGQSQGEELVPPISFPMN